MEQLAKSYEALLNKHAIAASDINYDTLHAMIPFLNQMASVKNSGLSVYDFFKKEHAYNSYNFNELFGYQDGKIETEYFDSRIHPEDHLDLMKIGIKSLFFFYQLPLSSRKHYKALNEYRILKGNNEYVRIIEQHQVLELDKKGNVWLALSVVDISPNQDLSDGVLSQMINTKSGEIYTPEINEKEKQALSISKREAEILNLIKEGLLSKEISSKLSISTNTVNTHRQNILKKLGVNNSFEAISFASKLNLI
jgi:DNA-binding CsgD family transcriptional regulator